MYVSLIQMVVHVTLALIFINALNLDFLSIASATVLSSVIVWVLYELLSWRKEELADAMFLPNAETF